MKHHTLALLLILGCCLGAHAQDISYATDEECGCDIMYVNGFETTRDGDRYGFRRYDGTVIAPNIYKHVGTFTNGYCKVWLEENQCGLLDSTGRVVVPCEYNDLDYPAENRILVARDGLFGYTDLDGQVVIPLQYPSASPFSEGKAVAVVFVDSFFVACTYIDTLGRRLMEPVFQNAMPYRDGVAAIRRYDRWGFIDHTGREVLPTVYEVLSLPDHGVFFAGDDYSVALFSRETMKPITKQVYTINSLVRDGRLHVVRDGKHGFLDLQGKEVIPCRYDEAGDFAQGRAMVRMGDRYGIIDTTGAIILPIEYINRATKGHKYIYYDGLALVERADGMLGYVDLNGQLAFPYWFPEAYQFSEGLAAVRHGGAWGYIDTKGELYLPLVFDLASPFEHGRAQVLFNGDYRMMDRRGRCVRNCKGIIAWREQTE